MSSGPGTVEFDTKKMPCPNCGTVGKIFKVSEINEKPVNIHIVVWNVNLFL